MLTVPFNHAWADSGSKMDLKGLYHSTKPGDDRYMWDLPIRRHNDWRSHGYEYISLSTTADVLAVRSELVVQKIDLNELQKSYEFGERGRFKLEQYWAETGQREAAEAADIEARLARIKSTGKGKAKGEAA